MQNAPWRSLNFMSELDISRKTTMRFSSLYFATPKQTNQAFLKSYRLSEAANS